MLFCISTDSYLHCYQCPISYKLQSCRIALRSPGRVPQAGLPVTFVPIAKSPMIFLAVGDPMERFGAQGRAGPDKAFLVNTFPDSSLCVGGPGGSKTGCSR